MNAFLCQSEIVWEDKQANFKRVRALLDAAGIPPGSLIVLPEMFATGFSQNLTAIQEPVGGETEQFLIKLAGAFQSCVIGGVTILGPDQRGRNQSLTISPDGQILARYSKIQPFSLGGESAVCTAGDEVVLCEWQGFKMSPFVCYDLRFPEIFRVAAQQGAELITVIANWPVKRVGHWVTLLQARAIENQAYVIGVNRSGGDPYHPYPGRSLVVDPHGAILLDAGEKEGVFSTNITVEVVRQWRQNFPALQDIRPRFAPKAH